jgi:hypothetical protein
MRANKFLNYVYSIRAYAVHSFYHGLAYFVVFCGTPVYYTNKYDSHDWKEKLLKTAYFFLIVFCFCLPNSTYFNQENHTKGLLIYCDNVLFIM